MDPPKSAKRAAPIGCTRGFGPPRWVSARSAALVLTEPPADAVGASDPVLTMTSSNWRDDRCSSGSISTPERAPNNLRPLDPGP